MIWVDRGVDVVRELDLRHRAQAVERRADRQPHHRDLGDRGVHHPMFAKPRQQPVRRQEHPALAGDVFAQHKDPRIGGHCVRHGGANRLKQSHLRHRCPSETAITAEVQGTQRSRDQKSKRENLKTQRRRARRDQEIKRTFACSAPSASLRSRSINVSAASAPSASLRSWSVNVSAASAASASLRSRSRSWPVHVREQAL